MNRTLDLFCTRALWLLLVLPVIAALVLLPATPALADDDDDEANEATLETLDELELSLDVEEVSILSVLRMVSEEAEVPLDVHPDVEEEVDLEEEEISLSMLDVAASSWIDLLCAYVGLDWTVIDGVIVVHTMEADLDDYEPTVDDDDEGDDDEEEDDDD